MEKLNFSRDPVCNSHFSELCCNPLSTRQYVHNVPILNKVRLPFEPIDSLALGILHRAGTLEVGVTDHLGTHEAAREVGVDLAGTDHGVGTLRHGPGSALVLADG